MATILRRGRKKIMSNNGHVQVDVTGNRILQYDGTKYRFLVGDKDAATSKVLMSKPNENVLEL